MLKITLLTCFVVIFTCGRGTSGLDRRITEALQNANQDFLSIEGNRRPAAPSPVNPNLQNVNLKEPSTSTTTLRTTVKPTTPQSTVKQLINQFNDNGRQGNQGNQPNSNPQAASPNSRTTSIGTSSNNQQNFNNGPTIPTRQKPGGPSVGNQRPAIVSPGSQPSSTTKEAFPNLPKSSGTSVTTSATPTKPISWSSVVSGNSKPGAGSPQGGISPENTPKTAQNLKPIVIGDRDHPSTGVPQTTGTPVKELISDSELKELSEAILQKDVNNAAKYITVNYQGKTSSFSKDDLAPQKLLTLQPAVWNIPTVSAMKVLLDNYEQDTTVNEYITPQEKNEENEFLDAIMATSVIRHLMNFLKEKGVVTPDPRQQRDVLKQIWFNMYSRGQGKIGSSGFEHIFLSEIKNGEISGLHNWIYFSTEETANRANYLGYLKKIDLGDKGAILKLHFNLKGIDKPVDTMFVGTSPELEIAMYSLCFLARADRACPLSLAGQNFNLRTHNYRYRSKNMIGSAFPEI